MASRTLELVLKLQDDASKKLSASFNAWEASASKLGRGFAAVGTAVTGFGAFAVSAASDLQQMEVAFSTMLGSAEQAQTFIEQMKDFAKKTPLETSDIAQGAQTLLAFGIASEKVLPNLRIIGDVALGNKEKFKSLSLAFAQVQSTGRLMGQDLLQMVNQGFNPLQILSEKTGKSMAVLKDEMAAGAISADMVTEAFMIATSEGGRFFQGMEAQSQTFAGTLSTLKDEFALLLAQIGSALLPVLQSMVPVLQSVIDKVSVWIAENPKLFDILVKIVAVFGTLMLVLSPILLILPGIVSAFTALSAIMGVVSTVATAVAVAIGAISAPVLAVVAAIAAVIAIGWLLITNWETIQVKAVEVWTQISLWFGGFIDSMYAKIMSGITRASEAFKAFGTGIKDFFVGVWDGIKEGITSSINWIIKKINGFIDAANEISAALSEVPGVSIPKIPKIPMLAKGGIVNKPTLAMVGEAGPEAVIPLSKLGSMGAGTNVYVTVNGDVSGKELIDKVQKGIMDSLRMNQRLSVA